MNYEATLTQAAAARRPDTPAPAVDTPAPAQQPKRVPPSAAIAAMSTMLLVWAWNVHHAGLYQSGKGLGYVLGLVGGSLMLVLLLYPLRKHLRVMHEWGPLKYWFRFHMIAGVLGPLLVLFHSTFRVGSLNAAVALACMLLVVASGLAGRFLYRKIHHGLYGSRASLQELQQTLAREREALSHLLARLPQVEREIDRFAALVAHEPQGWYRRWAHFLSLGAKRALAVHRARRAVAAHGVRSDLAALLVTIDATLKAVQRTAQFSTYERLFSLWHVVHIPFLCMLVITALIHVVAVHVY